MASGSISFQVLLGDQLVFVKTFEKRPVSLLFEDLQASSRAAERALSRLRYDDCKYYGLESPLLLPATRDAEIIHKCMDASNRKEFDIFGTIEQLNCKPASYYIHMVIELPGDARRKIVATLNADHTELFHCLQIRVSNLQSWTETDILANLDGGNFLTNPPAEMARIEGGLSRRRIHNLDTKNKDLVSARSYLQQFNKIFMKQSSGPVSVTDPREFVAFYNVHRCYCEDAASIRANTSSSLKASSFTVYFIHPPFFSERKSSAQFEYKEQMPWKFPIFLSTHTSPDSWCKFTPNNDFSASSPTHLCPFVISEVVSQTTEQARYQMLVEAIAAVRVGHYLLKSGSDKQFFIVAIYLRENMTAERFIVTHTGKGREVSIAQRDFDLTTADDATAFFREMYNLATELEDLGKALDDRKKESLQKLRDAASKLPSLTSEARGQKTTTARTTLTSDRDE